MGDSIQYWIYAFLNKKFGKEVRIDRSFLARKYDVNKHDFKITTNTLSIKTVYEYFIQTLISSGYEKEKNERNAYVVSRDGYDNYVHVRNDFNEINVSIFSYKK